MVIPVIGRVVVRVAGVRQIGDHAAKSQDGQEDTEHSAIVARSCNQMYGSRRFSGFEESNAA